MGSLGTEAPAEVKLPTVKLDTTLTELYRLASPKDAHTRLGWVSCGITSGVDFTADFPRNVKFVYEDQTFVSIPSRKLSNGNGKLKHSLAKKHLSLIPQRDAFISGTAPVIFFNLGRSPEQVEHDRREAEATISVLDPSQRPELVFCPGPSKIPMQEHSINKLEYKVIFDGLEAYPLTHDLETHWLLNSKAGLARSGLPTPSSQIIETEGYPPPPESCCVVCREPAANPSSHLPSIPRMCTGPRGEWLARETHRILAAVRARRVPFVFKTQQAFGGAGTWLVTTQDQKEQLLADLSGSSPTQNEVNDGKGKREEEEEEQDSGLLGKLLPLLTPSNAHLRPTTVLLTDLVSDPTGDYGLTFVVTSSESGTGSGEPLFLAAAEQMITDDGSSAWIGSRIHYGRQEELRNKFQGLVERIARWVAGHGYVGPVGADVLCTSRSSSGGGSSRSPGGGGPGEEGDGGCYIVDLNVRTSGSVSLPLLRGHFMGKGLECASSFSIQVRGGRREFVEKWRGAFEEGRMLILSWYEDLEEGASIADVVVGAEDEERLAELMREVRLNTEEVTF
ncbi:hypothetical protein N658DRAFT_554375 [Parathielavia hyrcaniae]|uniref:ATP-grasp domain-containing protein n=1 Tax=Parathielavia hyrcaniae TaxID=113614 RepID=A0AAN6Q5V9_9PEZI|nr:hypothetical protein N658DRAFT_554375 [Parathielavia hyrcaniae]